MAKSLKQSTRQNSKKKTVPKSSKPKVQSSSVVDDCQVIHHSPIQIRQLANKFDNLPLIFVDIIKKENKPSEFHHHWHYALKTYKSDNIAEEMCKLGEDPHYFCLEERNNKHSTTTSYKTNQQCECCSEQWNTPPGTNLFLATEKQTNDKPAMRIFIYENNKSMPVIIESEKQTLYY
ncbi:hypothetical protein BLOT_000525 [Blomia tropicalis]|nr:hypothetical protein BLOT_000525 [Blomia tropicalis]